MKQENPRSSEISPTVATLIVTFSAKKVCVSATLCAFSQALSFSKCANMHCADVD